MASHALQSGPPCRGARLAGALALLVMLVPAQVVASPQSESGGFDDIETLFETLGGAARADPLAEAKRRHRLAVGGAGEGLAGVGDVALAFSPSESSELIARGWPTPGLPANGFGSDGQRLRTMIALARRLGYGARTGALQARFGTPYELGIAEVEVELETARVALTAAPQDPEAAAWVEELETEIAVLAAAAKPGNGPSARWARANLDVNGDGGVDPADLAALDAGRMPAMLPAGFSRAPGPARPEQRDGLR
jgi:hypothetical protein